MKNRRSLFALFIIITVLFLIYNTAHAGSGIVESDLSISASDITFSDNTPIRGSTITIFATIHNDWFASTDTPVYCDPNNNASDDAYYQADNQSYCAQSFQVNDIMQIEKVYIYCYDSGSTGDSLTLELRTDSSGDPSDTVLASDSGKGSSSAHWQEFSIDYTVYAGNTYWLVAKSTPTVGGQGWQWAYDNNVYPYEDGNFAYNTFGSWTPMSNFDFLFRVTGKPITVKFYDGDPDAGGVMIESTNTINVTIPQGGTTVSSVTWTNAPMGPHPIYVRIGYAGPERNNDLADNTTNTIFTVCTDPPEAISNLTALTHGSTEGAVNLQWTSPGEDEDRGLVSAYELKFSTNGIITNSGSSYSDADIYNYAWDTTTFKVAGNDESITVTGLIRGATYWFALKGQDADSQWSLWESSSEATGVNTLCSAEALDIAPSSPTALNVTAGDGQILSSWTAPSPMPDDFAFYRVYCDETSPLGSWTDQFIATETTNTSFLHTGLGHFNTYYYRVVTVDEGPRFMESLYSNVDSTACIPPYAPTDFEGTAQSTGSINWTWTDNSAIEDGYRITSDTDGVVATPAIDDTSWMEVDLDLNTSYYRYIQAYNTYGSSPAASCPNPDICYTLANPPTGSDVVSVSSFSVQLDWEPNSNPTYTRWGIKRSTDVFTSSTTVKQFSDALTDTEHTDDGLQPFTSYWYKIKAYNGDGIVTAYHVQVPTRTNPGPPPAPTNFGGVAVSSTIIHWTWTDNSDTLWREDGFRVYSDTGGVLQELSSNVTFWTEVGRTINNTYTRYVEAYNVTAFSVSNSSSRYTLANPPTGSYNISVTSGSVQMEWFANNNPAGTIWGIIRSSTAFATSTDTVRQFSDGLTATTYSDGDLEPLTTYWYKICAYNHDGLITAYDTEFSTRTDPGPPPAPSDFGGFALSTGSIFWSWTDNSMYKYREDGFRVLTDTDGVLVELGEGATTWTECDLGLNAAYTRKAQAWNITDYSVSNSSMIYTLANPPTGSYVVSVTSWSVQLDWFANSDPSYTVWGIIRSQDVFASTSSVLDFGDGLTDTTYIDDSVQALTTYYYKICAYNGDGRATLFDIMLTTRTNPGPPPAPDPFAGTALSTGSIQWAWTDNSSGQSQEDGFRIYSATDGVLYNFPPDVTACIESNMSLNTSYYRYIDVYNVTATSATVPDICFTLANPPTMSYVVSVTSGSVQLAWQSNDNPSHTVWGIVRSLDQFATTTTVLDFSDGLTDTTYSDGNLQSLTTYYYKICAYNGDGIPTIYDVMLTTRTNPGAPPAPTDFTGVALSTGSIRWSWTDNSSDPEAEDGFRIISDTGGVVKELEPDTTTWLEDNLSVNTSYYRYCQAYNVTGYNDSASTITFTLANPPTGTYVLDVTAYSIKLEWYPNGDPAHTCWGIISSSFNFTIDTVTVLDFSDSYSSTTYRVPNLAPETTYWLKVLGYNGDGIPTLYDTKVSTVTHPAIPDMPTDFIGTAISTGSIRWSWTDNSLYEEGFWIKTSTGGILADLDIDTTSWLEVDLGLNTSYYRYCEAYNVTGSSESAPDICYTLANMPTNSYVIEVSSVWVKIGWGANDNPPYTVYGVVNSSDYPSGSNPRVSLKGYSDSYSSTTFLHTDLWPGTTYAYWVNAYNGVYGYQRSSATAYDVRLTTITTAILPKAPTGFIGVALSTESIHWSWTDNAVYENGFHVVTDTGGIMAVLPVNTTYWIETGLTLDTSYYRYAQTYTAAGSSPSLSDVRFTHAKAPWPVAVTSSTYHGVQFFWWEECGTRLKVDISSVSTSFNVGVTSRTWYDNLSSSLCWVNQLYLDTTYYFRLWCYNGDQILSSSYTVVSGYTLDLPPTITKLNPSTTGSQTIDQIMNGTSVQVKIDVDIGTIDVPAYIPINIDALDDPVEEDPLIIQSANTDLIADTYLRILEESAVELNLYDFKGVIISTPNNSMTLTLSYPDEDDDGLVDDSVTRYREVVLTIVTLNSAMQKWEEITGCTVDKDNNTVSVAVPHFSLFAIASKGPESGKEGRIYPNPFKPNSGLGHTEITFSNMQVGSTIRVYNLVGNLVWKVDNISQKDVTWDGTNASGKRLASGVYILVGTVSDGSTTKAHFAIIR